MTNGVYVITDSSLLVIVPDLAASGAVVAVQTRGARWLHGDQTNRQAERVQSRPAESESAHTESESESESEVTEV